MISRYINQLKLLRGAVLKLSIKQKVRCFAALAVLNAIVVGGVSYYQQTAASASLEHLLAIMGTLHTHMEADMAHDAVNSDVMGFLAAGATGADSAAYAKALANDASVLSELVEKNRLNPSIDSTSKALLGKATPLVQAYTDSAKRLVENGPNRTALATNMEIFSANFEVLKKLFGEISKNFESDARDSRAGVGPAQEKMQRTTVGIIGCAVMLSLLASWVLFRLVYRPLEVFAIHLEQISSGASSYNVTLDASGTDEMSWMASSINRLLKKINGAMGSVIQISHALSVSAEQLNGLSSEVRIELATQHSEIEKVASAVDEMSAAAVLVATNANTAAVAVQQTNSEIRASNKVVETVVNSFNTMAREVARISKLMDDIRSIAEQTNLLALNAAIEAARAGEQGRGFAVVADEVRTLANRTQTSTSEIAETITRMQNGARAAVAVIEQSQFRGTDTSGNACDAATALATMTAQIDTLAAMNSKIASAAEEQSAVSKSVKASVFSIRDIAEKTGRSSEQTAQAANELERLSRDLTASVNMFRAA